MALFWRKLVDWLSKQGLNLLLSPINTIWAFQEEQNILLNIIVLLGNCFIFKKEKNIMLLNRVYHVTETPLFIH